MGSEPLNGSVSEKQLSGVPIRMSQARIISSPPDEQTPDTSETIGTFNLDNAVAGSGEID